jgi:hypothetical protein
MPRCWVRLVAVVTLVVYLTSSGMLMAYTHGLSSQCTCHCETFSPSSEDSSTNCADSGCKNCRCLSGEVQKQTQTYDSSPNAQDEQVGLSNRPGPCKGDHPRCPSCPWPGGCMFCNAAKVPCLFGCNLTVTEPTPLTDFVIETPQVEAAHFYGKLFRPPRV